MNLMKDRDRSRKYSTLKLHVHFLYCTYGTVSPKFGQKLAISCHTTRARVRMIQFRLEIPFQIDIKSSLRFIAIALESIFRSDCPDESI